MGRHSFHRFAATIKTAKAINGKDSLQAFRIEFFQALFRGDNASVVDQGRELAKILINFSENIIDRIFIGNIKLQGNYLALVSAKIGGQRQRRCLLLSVSETNRVELFGGYSCNAGANATTATGDEKYFLQ